MSGSGGSGSLAFTGEPSWIPLAGVVALTCDTAVITRSNGQYLPDSLRPAPSSVKGNAA